MFTFVVFSTISWNIVIVLVVSLLFLVGVASSLLEAQSYNDSSGIVHTMPRYLRLMTSSVGELG
jgi:hypothetical protein